MTTRMATGWASLLLAVTVLSASAADVYEIDKAHTTVGFSISHMVINDVDGNFRKFEGEVEYDPADPAVFSVKGEIDVASIDTGIDDRDQHLRGPDFFDVAKFPKITFRSEKAVKEGETIVVTGPFTMHGVTKKISLPIRIKGPITDGWGKTRIGLQANILLDRRDYGIIWSKLLDNGGLVVGNEVNVQIKAEAIRKEPPTSAAGTD